MKIDKRRATGRAFFFVYAKSATTRISQSGHNGFRARFRGIQSVENGSQIYEKGVNILAGMNFPEPLLLGMRTIRSLELLVWIGVRLPLIAILPVSQVWFMLVARWLKIWPEPGIFWFDWIGALLVPGFVMIRTMI